MKQIGTRKGGGCVLCGRFGYYQSVSPAKTDHGKAGTWQSKGWGWGRIFFAVQDAYQLCRMHISCTKHDAICHFLFLSNNTHDRFGGLCVRNVTSGWNRLNPWLDANIWSSWYYRVGWGSGLSQEWFDVSMPAWNELAATSVKNLQKKALDAEIEKES